jgi:hypothetical protein
MHPNKMEEYEIINLLYFKRCSAFRQWAESLGIQIVIQKMKISAASKTFDVSDRSELGPDSYG